MLLPILMAKQPESGFAWIDPELVFGNWIGQQRVKGNRVVLLIGWIVGSNAVSMPSLVVHRKEGSKEPMTAALMVE